MPSCKTYVDPDKNTDQPELTPPYNTDVELTTLNSKELPPAYEPDDKDEEHPINATTTHPGPIMPTISASTLIERPSIKVVPIGTRVSNVGDKSDFPSTDV